MLILRVLSCVANRQTYFMPNRRFPRGYTRRDNGVSCERRITSKEMMENETMRRPSIGSQL